MFADCRIEGSHAAFIENLAVVQIPATLSVSEDVDVAVGQYDNEVFVMGILAADNDVPRRERRSDRLAAIQKSRSGVLRPLHPAHVPPHQRPAASPILLRLSADVHLADRRMASCSVARIFPSSSMTRLPRKQASPRGRSGARPSRTWRACSNAWRSCGEHLLIVSGRRCAARHRRHGVNTTPNGPSPTVMSIGFLVLVFTSSVDTELPLPKGSPALPTKAVFPSGVTATPPGPGPTGMSAAFFVLVFTSIVDSVPLPLLETNAVLLSGVNAAEPGREPTGMSVGFLVLVFTSIVDTVSLSKLATKSVFPFGVTAIPNGYAPTGMSVGSLVLVLTSIVDTRPLPVPIPPLATKAVLPSAVNVSPLAPMGTEMSVGSLVPVLVSIVDTDPP